MGESSSDYQCRTWNPEVRFKKHPPNTAGGTPREHSTISVVLSCWATPLGRANTQRDILNNNIHVILYTNQSETCIPIT